jgi:hypothetical protein
MQLPHLPLTAAGGPKPPPATVLPRPVSPRRQAAHHRQILVQGHQRWPIETGWRECKTHLRGSGRALRGKTPALARQELWALLAVYQATRVLIARAAAGAGLDPARISFTAALDAARRTMTASRRHLRASLDTAEAEILSALVPERPHRICARTVKRVPFARWPARKRSQAPIPRRATRTATITPPGTSTPTTPDQRKQPATTKTQPP